MIFSPLARRTNRSKYSSIEIFARVLHQFSVPRNVILDLVGQIRQGMYGMLRSAQPERGSIHQNLSALEGIEIERLKVHPGSPAAGQTLADLELRARTGASVLVVQRGESALTNPVADFRIEGGDVLVVLGDRAALDAALALLDPAVAVA